MEDGTSFKFFQSYIDLTEDEYKLAKAVGQFKAEHPEKLTDEEIQELIKEIPILREHFLRPYMNNSSFREHLIEKEGYTTKIVKELASFLRSKMIRPQELCHDDDDYYIAIDRMTSTVYLCYRTLLMVDIDFYKNGKEGKEYTVDELMQQIKDYSQDKYTFAVYKTRNGLHAFLISEENSYKDDKSLQIMLDLNCDFYYIIYSYLRGWSVRLNKKENDTPDIYSYIGIVGKKKPNKNLVKLVNLHINIIQQGVFANISDSIMYAG